MTTDFRTWKSYKDVSKTTAKYARARGFEVLVYINDEQDTHNIEIWSDDDNAELPYLAYSVESFGTLYFFSKYQDIHKVMQTVEDLPLRLWSDSELRKVIDYLYQHIN